ncbi:MAG: hypothetical protein HY903_20445 [Deltaproteobacteria bacterium]|nr:hypothetical protein [Deltaproteobacteria bacterium]
MLALLCSIVCATAPTAAELAAAWQDLVASGAARVQISLPSPTADDWRTLASGTTIARRFRAGEGAMNRVLAMRFIDQPPVSIWLAILDGKHAGLPPEYSEWQLGATPTSKTLYQHLDLPFPIADRHWILIANSNRELYRDSGRTAWERSWALDPRGAAALADLPADVRAKGEGAIWTPKNRGGWLLLAAGWGTLAVYQLETDIGGWVPDHLVAAWALSTLAKLVDKTTALADREVTHYVAGHAPLYTPDGVLIPRY